MFAHTVRGAARRRTLYRVSSSMEIRVVALLLLFSLPLLIAGTIRLAKSKCNEKSNCRDLCKRPEISEKFRHECRTKCRGKTKNKEFTTCASRCPGTCADRSHNCTMQCKPGVFLRCADNMVQISKRNTKCVPAEDCLQYTSEILCGTNEEYTSCASRCPPTCDDQSNPCTMQCNSDVNCRCKDAMVYRSEHNKTCILRKQCPGETSFEYPTTSLTSSVPRSIPLTKQITESTLRAFTTVQVIPTTQQLKTPQIVFSTTEIKTTVAPTDASEAPTSERLSTYSKTTGTAIVRVGVSSTPMLETNIETTQAAATTTEITVPTVAKTTGHTTAISSVQNSTNTYMTVTTETTSQMTSAKQTFDPTTSSISFATHSDNTTNIQTTASTDARPLIQSTAPGDISCLDKCTEYHKSCISDKKLTKMYKKLGIPCMDFLQKQGCELGNVHLIACMQKYIKTAISLNYTICVMPKAILPKKIEACEKCMSDCKEKRSSAGTVIAPTVLTREAKLQVDLLDVSPESIPYSAVTVSLSPPQADPCQRKCVVNKACLSLDVLAAIHVGLTTECRKYLQDMKCDTQNPSWADCMLDHLTTSKKNVPSTCELPGEVTDRRIEACNQCKAECRGVPAPLVTNTHQYCYGYCVNEGQCYTQTSLRELVAKFPGQCQDMVTFNCGSHQQGTLHYLQCVFRHALTSPEICDWEDIGAELRREEDCEACVNDCLETAKEQESCSLKCEYSDKCATVKEKEEIFRRVPESCKNCVQKICVRNIYESDCIYTEMRSGRCQIECNNINSCDYCFKCPAVG